MCDSGDFLIDFYYETFKNSSLKMASNFKYCEFDLTKGLVNFFVIIPRVIKKWLLWEINAMKNLIIVIGII